MTQHFSENLLTINEAEVFVFPASFAQQRLWFLDQLFPGNTFYNVATAIRLTGSLNLAALEETFNEIVRRHETLRTTFRILEGQPVQAIAPSFCLSLPVVDLRSLPIAEQEAETRLLAIKEQARPFDLSSGPLLRVMLLQLDSSEHVLLLNLHHCLGWLVYWGANSGTRSTLHSLIQQPAINSARTADPICRLCPLAARVATG